MKKLIEWYFKTEYQIQPDVSFRMVIAYSMCIIFAIFTFFLAIFSFSRGDIVSTLFMVSLTTIQILTLEIGSLQIAYAITKNEEKYFIKFMRDDSRINYIVNGTLIRKLSNDNKQKSLDIGHKCLDVESDFLKDDKNLMWLLAYIKLLLVAQMQEEDDTRKSFEAGGKNEQNRMD
ncbi:MAG: hypothetical protein IJ950_01660 [Helicobacter sp.]|nr:hypothetical protein [Helicobacter sp.]